MHSVVSIQLSLNVPKQRYSKDRIQHWVHSAVSCFRTLVEGKSGFSFSKLKELYYDFLLCLYVSHKNHLFMDRAVWLCFGEVCLVLPQIFRAGFAQPLVIIILIIYN
jgi:hypothetical protein